MERDVPPRANMAEPASERKASVSRKCELEGVTVSSFGTEALDRVDIPSASMKWRHC